MTRSETHYIACPPSSFVKTALPHNNQDHLNLILILNPDQILTEQVAK
jgi:hypothetical protein